MAELQIGHFKEWLSKPENRQNTATIREVTLDGFKRAIGAEWLKKDDNGVVIVLTIDFLRSVIVSDRFFDHYEPNTEVSAANLQQIITTGQIGELFEAPLFTDSFMPHEQQFLAKSMVVPYYAFTGEPPQWIAEPSLQEPEPSLLEPPSPSEESRQ